jgi:hypothetical protein
MDNKQIVAELLWDGALATAVGKKVQVAHYPKLRDAIADQFLDIQDVISFQDADEVFERFKPYLVQFGVAPILGTLGRNVLCIGVTEENREVICYFDFDFGLFELDRSLKTFIERLVVGMSP